MSGKIVIEFTPAEFDLVVAAADALITEMGMLGGDSRADEAIALLDRLEKMQYEMMEEKADD